ncbi:MAG: protein kinase [Polyangia bacterium]
MPPSAAAASANEPSGPDPHETTAFAATEAAPAEHRVPPDVSPPAGRGGPGRTPGARTTTGTTTGTAAGSLEGGNETTPPAEVRGYDILRPLGRGAFGTVWLARQQNTGKLVAIKFYAHAGGLDLHLLQREVEKLAFLYTERDIVQLIEVGWDATPPFYVMEYLERGSLETLVRRGALPVSEAVRITRAVAQALVHAHGRGILHCDLKPANVLLDGDMKPRLADFGQSRLPGDESLGPALGTFFYMAPEQADLLAVPDARWDVYALGAMLFAMLTGSPPHRSAETRRHLSQATTLHERLHAYRELVYAAPSPAGELDAIDAPLRQIVARSLALAPEDRYPNAQAMLSALVARDAERARRPLLLLGALGPALLLLVMLLVGAQVLRTAVGTSRQALTRRALESGRFAARFVAETAAREVDRRWGALEEEAATPAVRADLAEIARQRIATAQGERLRQRLQQFIEEISTEHAELGATSWFLADATGLQWARVPESETIGKSWAFRDYFHGRGRDLPRDQVPADLRPIRAPHRSVVFSSQASGNRIVAFSVPIWSGRRDDPRSQVLGVLGMTVELGRFGELRPGAREGSRQVAVLVDSREDASGHKGLLLQHPALLERLRHRQPLPSYHVSAALVDRMERLRSEARADLARPGEALHRDPGEATPRGPLAVAAGEPGVDTEYEDPTGGAYAGRWLAAMEPVLARGQDTGWVVVVQERHPDITGPIDQLGRTLLRIGILGLAAAAALLTLLWLVVFRLLHEEPRPTLRSSRLPERAEEGLAFDETYVP